MPFHPKGFVICIYFTRGMSIYCHGTWSRFESQECETWCWPFEQDDGWNICCNHCNLTPSPKKSRDLISEHIWTACDSSSKPSSHRLTVDQCSKGAKVHGIPAICKMRQRKRLWQPDLPGETQKRNMQILSVLPSVLRCQQKKRVKITIVTRSWIGTY